MSDFPSPEVPPGYTSEQDRALRMLTYGCYVVSAADEDGSPSATMVSWVSQASFRPPLVMIAVQSDGPLARAIDSSEKFAVNVVGDSQVDLAERYIRHETYVPPEPADFETGEDFEVPTLKEAPCCVGCRLVGKLTGGDHSIFVGQVETAVIRDDDVRPLMLADTPWVYAGLMGRE